MVDGLIPQIQELIETMVDRDCFSGTVLIAQEGDILFEEAYGLAEKRFKAPNTVDTIYNVGSLNKLITKIAILQLLQKGSIEMDRPIGAYLTGYSEEVLSKVTVRHLLTFTSGMGDYFNDRFAHSIGNLRTLDDFVQLFIDEPLRFEPGTERLYSNAGYVVLGKIIEEVTGQDYYEYVRENIYRPAGMNHTDHYELDRPIPNLATGYTKHKPDGTVSSAERRNNFFVIGTRGSSAGGGHSTVHDWLSLDTAISEGILLDENYNKMILRPINGSPDAVPKAIAMAGGAPGLTALYLKFVGAGLTVLVFSNYDPDDVEPLAGKIRGIVEPISEVGS